MNWPVVPTVVVPAPDATANPPAPTVKVWLPATMSPAALVTRTLLTAVLAPRIVPGRLAGLVLPKTTSVAALGRMPVSAVPASSDAQLVLPALLVLQLLLTS